MDKYGTPLWIKVVEKGKKIEGSPISNSLTDIQITEIASRFSDASSMQLLWDLKKARYRLFDELGMMITGRVDEADSKEAEEMAEIFAKCLDNEEVKDRKTLYDCFFKKLAVKGVPPIQVRSWNKLEEVE